MPELRDYQRSAIDKIRNYFAKGKKNVLLVAPTGSGKTVIASSMIDQALSKGKSCLFVAHRRELVMQCSRKLADFRVNHGVLMANKSETEEAKVQVASVQTFTARKDRDDFVKPQADLVILDEAQNVSPMQIKTLMTRISDNCKMIMQGDLSQCDKFKTNGVTNYEKSGFYDVWFRLQGVEGVEHMAFSRDDCIRHPLVKRILKTYEDEHEIDLVNKS